MGMIHGQNQKRENMKITENREIIIARKIGRNRIGKKNGNQLGRNQNGEEIKITERKNQLMKVGDQKLRKFRDNSLNSVEIERNQDKKRKIRIKSGKLGYKLEFCLANEKIPPSFPQLLDAICNCSMEEIEKMITDSAQ